MPKRNRNQPKSYYELSEVKAKIAAGNVLVRPDVVRDALVDFGWGIDDILDVYRKLRPGHFLIADNSRTKFFIVIDSYKARINGEEIYTHFYIDDDGRLVINSFHRPRL